MKASSLHSSRILVSCLVALLLLTSGCDLGALAPASSLPRNTWVSLGPEGGSVADLVVDPKNPSNLYATLGIGGIFKSMDGGRKWKALPNAPGWTYKLAIDPKAPSTLYAAGFGLSKSMDGGETWTELLPPISSDFPLMDLAIDPVTPTILYTGIAYVMKSTDGGKTWDSFKPGESGGILSQLLVDQEKPTTLYAALYGSFKAGSGSVMKSTDGGKNWDKADTGLPDSEEGVRAMALTPGSNSTLYIGTESGKVFKSTDAGGSWTACEIDLTEGDKGIVSSLAVDAKDPDTVYAGTSGGIYKSTDGCKSWQILNTSMPSYVSTLVIDPKNPSSLYAGTGSEGIYKSVDAGKSWKAANSGLNGSSTITLALDSQKSGNLYATVAGRGLFKSTDAGMNWDRIGTGLPNNSISALAVDPLEPDTLYASTGYTGMRVYKSSDGGKNWSAANSGMDDRATVDCFSFHPGDPSTLYAGTTHDGIYKSTDAGGNWEQLSRGMDSNNPISNPFSLAIDPGEPATMYVGTTEGIFKTTDGGKNWSKPNTGISSGNSSCNEGVCTTAADDGTITHILAIDPRNPRILFAGTYRGLYKSTDAGTRWRLVNTGLPEGGIYALAIDPQAPSTVFAGTWGKGVYRSTDGGESWHEFNTNLANKGILTLMMDPHNPGRLYVGTHGGVYLIDYAGVESSLQTSPMEPAESTSTPVPAQVSGRTLRFVSPQDGATLGYDALNFQVEPVQGADGYAYTFIQDGKTIWDTMRDESRLYGTQYGVVFDRLIGLLSPGELQVQVRARVKGVWTEPASLTIHLRERQPTSTQPSQTSPPPKLNLRINYGDDWVESFYEGGHMAKITVFDSFGLTIKATAESVIEPKDFWDGRTGFHTRVEDWVPAPPDIQPNDWVYGEVDNGAFTKVRVGDITGTIDLAADSIQGRILAPWVTGSVHYECLDWGSGREQPYSDRGVWNVSFQPDGYVLYLCSWAGEWDIQAGQKIGVGYVDSDGNWVANSFGLTNPNQVPTSTPPPAMPTATVVLPTSGNLALGRPTTASHSEASRPSSRAVDGNTSTDWSSGSFPQQWIEIDLGAPATISLINLLVTQDPGGATIHQILVGSDKDTLHEVHRFVQRTTSGQWLTFAPETPFKYVRWVKIATIKSPSWVGWVEIEVIGTR